MHETPSPRPVSDESVEQEIQRKGLTAARVTPADLESAIAAEYAFTPMRALDTAPVRVGDEVPLSLLTICVLVLKNGFTVVGTSACASPENFDPELGAKIARENAKQQMWPLMGYALKEKLASA